VEKLKKWITTIKIPIVVTLKGTEIKKEVKRKERGSYFSFLLYCEMNISPSIDATGRAIDGNSGI
jgi:hypothetical protein